MHDGKVICLQSSLVKTSRAKEPGLRQLLQIVLHQGLPDNDTVAVYKTARQVQKGDHYKVNNNHIKLRKQTNKQTNKQGLNKTVLNTGEHSRLILSAYRVLRLLKSFIMIFNILPILFVSKSLEMIWKKLATSLINVLQAQEAPTGNNIT